MKPFFSMRSILGAGTVDKIVDKSRNKTVNNNQNVLSEKERLLQDIQKTQHALESAYCGFDNATDFDLIDCYIYEIESTLKRYRFLLQKANQMQLFCETEDFERRVVLPAGIAANPKFEG